MDLLGLYEIFFLLHYHVITINRLFHILAAVMGNAAQWPIVRRHVSGTVGAEVDDERNQGVNK